MACLRVVYGPRVHSANAPIADKLALVGMAQDFGDVVHEFVCAGCDRCVRGALRIEVVDQTYGVAIGPTRRSELSDGWWLLLTSWMDPFGELSPDECIDLVTRWLLAAGWKPDDGGERAAKICDLAEKATRRVMLRAERRARRREEIAHGRELDELIAEHKATGTTFCG